MVVEHLNICKDTCANKRYRKLKGQSRMEKPEKLATLEGEQSSMVVEHLKFILFIVYRRRLKQNK
jgi:hypothetical protein